MDKLHIGVTESPQYLALTRSDSEGATLNSLLQEQLPSISSGVAKATDLTPASSAREGGTTLDSKNFQPAPSTVGQDAYHNFVSARSAARRGYYVGVRYSTGLDFDPSMDSSIMAYSSYQESHIVRLQGSVPTYRYGYFYPQASCVTLEATYLAGTVHFPPQPPLLIPVLPHGYTSVSTTYGQIALPSAQRPSQYPGRFFPHLVLQRVPSLVTEEHSSENEINNNI